MINVADIMRQMTANAEAMRALLQTVSAEQALWKPTSQAWSLKEVMGHVYNEERIDFRKHLKEMLADPPEPWGGSHPEDWLKIESCQQALESFIIEREASLA